MIGLSMFNSGFTLELAVLIVASIATLGIGFFALSRNFNSATNRLFAIISVCLVAWSFASYYSLRTTGDSALLDIKIIFACVVLQNTGFLFLSYTYPLAEFLHPKRLTVTYLLLAIAILATLPTRLIIEGYDDGTGLIPGPLISLFMVHAAISVVMGFIQLIRRFRKSEFEERSRVGYLLLGSMILWGVVPLTNFVLPLAFEINVFVKASSLYVLMFSAILGVAIIKHRLFDIRLIVARSLAYLLTFGSFLVIYSGLFFLVASILLPNNDINIKQSLAFAVLAVIFSPTVGLAKHYFDKYTNKVFYRDAYDSQTVLAELNNVLVSSIKIEILLTKSAAIIDKNLKVSFCSFAIFQESNKLRYEGSGVFKPSEETTNFIASMRIKNIVVVDDLRIHHHNDYELLRKNRIAVVVELSTHNGQIGYILLGEKLSGNTYGDGDIRLLRLIANELAIATQNALRFEEIEQFNATLQKKIEDATKELKKTNEKLKALDEAKDEFISMASHQLRTPLTSIKGYLSMVLEGDVGKISTEQRKMLATAFISSQRMVYLIADLLNVSRIQTGKFVIEPKAVYLPDVIADEITQISETAAAKGITISYKKPQKFPTVYLDETKIRQVIMNFADNAVYYTPANGEVTVELIEHTASIELLVIDNGIGVPKDEQHKLFTKFYRAANARKARPDGTGLGLFMAQKVIIASGGAIIFKSKEGVGSTFGFTFPKH